MRKRLEYLRAMSRLLPLLKTLGIIIVLVVGFFLLLNFLYMLSPFGGYDLLLIQFVTGFWNFLGNNLFMISADAGTWGPGLGSFMLALGLSHRFLAKWAAKNCRPWSFATSFCLMLVIPVLFVIAFIVPGVLLQWEILRQVPWIDVR